jgi:hypothetical protein
MPIDFIFPLVRKLFSAKGSKPGRYWVTQQKCRDMPG